MVSGGVVSNGKVVSADKSEMMMCWYLRGIHKLLFDHSKVVRL